MTEPVTILSAPSLAELMDGELLAQETEAPEQTIYSAWLDDGTLGDLEAARLIAPILRKVEREAEELQERIDRLKNMLRDIYTHTGLSVLALPDFDLELTRRAGYTKYTADPKVVRSIVSELRELGETHLVRLAAELEAGIKESPVVGGVTVGRPAKAKTKQP